MMPYAQFFLSAPFLTVTIIHRSLIFTCASSTSPVCSTTQNFSHNFLLLWNSPVSPHLISTHRFNYATTSSLKKTKMIDAHCGLTAFTSIRVWILNSHDEKYNSCSTLARTSTRPQADSENRSNTIFSSILYLSINIWGQSSTYLRFQDIKKPTSPHLHVYFHSGISLFPRFSPMGIWDRFERQRYRPQLRLLLDFQIEIIHSQATFLTSSSVKAPQKILLSGFQLLTEEINIPISAWIEDRYQGVAPDENQGCIARYLLHSSTCQTNLRSPRNGVI